MVDVSMVLRQTRRHVYVDTRHRVEIARRIDKQRVQVVSFRTQLVCDAAWACIDSVAPVHSQYGGVVAAGTWMVAATLRVPNLFDVDVSRSPVDHDTSARVDDMPFVSPARHAPGIAHRRAR